MTFSRVFIVHKVCAFWQRTRPVRRISTILFHLTVYLSSTCHIWASVHYSLLKLAVTAVESAFRRFLYLTFNARILRSSKPYLFSFCKVGFPQASVFLRVLYQWPGGNLHLIWLRFFVFLKYLYNDRLHIIVLCDILIRCSILDVTTSSSKIFPHRQNLRLAFHNTFYRCSTDLLDRISHLSQKFDTARRVSFPITIP